MADLTDVTITPMIAVGMGATIFAGLHFTDWSWPVVFGLGMTVGPVVGFGAGVVLFALVSGLIHGVVMIVEKGAIIKPVRGGEMEANTL